MLCFTCSGCELTLNFNLNDLLTLKGPSMSQGTAGQEAEAGMEMSALVNYIQPARFHAFSDADSKLQHFTSPHLSLRTPQQIIHLDYSLFSLASIIAERNRGYECTSFVETQATALLKEFPVDFVKYPLKTVCHIISGKIVNCYAADTPCFCNVLSSTSPLIL